MVKIFLRNDGKYLKSICGDNVNENIKMDIHIRNIYRPKYISYYSQVRPSTAIFRNDYVYSDSFVTFVFDYHLRIYERFDASRRHFLYV